MAAPGRMQRKLERWLPIVVLPPAVVAGGFLPLYAQYFIPSGAMTPSALIGDHIGVARLAYVDLGLSIEKMFAALGIDWFRSEPMRGDVIVFQYTGPNAVYAGSAYVKRVVALGSEAVQMRDGRLEINGRVVERQPLSAVPDSVWPVGAGYQRYQEMLPGGRTHEIVEIDDRQPLDNTPIIRVSPGSYFVMSDNRDNSMDSRSEGIWFVPRERIAGRAEIVMWSFTDNASFWQIWRWSSSMRGDRVMKALQ